MTSGEGAGPLETPGRMGSPAWGPEGEKPVEPAMVGNSEIIENMYIALVLSSPWHTAPKTLVISLAIKALEHLLF